MIAIGTDEEKAKMVGHTCALCTDATPFTAETAALSFRRPGEDERFAHQICFYPRRIAELEEAANDQHALIATLIACWGGKVNVNVKHVRIALNSGNEFTRTERPDGSVQFALGPKIAIHRAPEPAHGFKPTIVKDPVMESEIAAKFIEEEFRVNDKIMEDIVAHLDKRKNPVVMLEPGEIVIDDAKITEAQREGLKKMITEGGGTIEAFVGLIHKLKNGATLRVISTASPLPVPELDDSTRFWPNIETTDAPVPDAADLA